MNHIKLIESMDVGDVYYISIGSNKGIVMKCAVPSTDEHEWLLYESIERGTHKIFYGTYQYTELDALVRDAERYNR
jgi:hypothetical protein